MTTNNLFKILNKNGNFLFISTSEIYSGLKNKPDEEMIGNCNSNHPRSTYIQSKILGESIVNLYKNKGLNAKSVRLCLAYGPGNKKKDHRVLYQLIQKGLNSNKINLLDNGMAKRSYIYILDAIKMIINIFFFGKSNIYNVGGVKVLTIKKLATLISKKLNVNLIIPKIKIPLKSAPDLAVVNIEKYKHEFGNYKFTNIIKGLEKTIAWQKLL